MFIKIDVAEVKVRNAYEIRNEIQQNTYLMWLFKCSFDL